MSQIGFEWDLCRGISRLDIYLSLCQGVTAAISSVITQPLLGPENGLLAARLSFSIFPVVQITLTGGKKRGSSFSAESASSLAFTATSPNSKHISLLLQFSPRVMTASPCHDSDKESRWKEFSLGMKDAIKTKGDVGSKGRWNV